VGRLLARPTANLSLEAQQRRELKQKMFGDWIEVADDSEKAPPGAFFSHSNNNYSVV
jgi:hypothetical protein